MQVIVARGLATMVEYTDLMERDYYNIMYTTASIFPVSFILRVAH